MVEPQNLYATGEAVETRPIPVLGHNLSYTAIDHDTAIQQTCSVCGHSATGTLATSNYTYTGQRQEISFNTVGIWERPYPKIWEANNDYINAGEKTAYAEIGGVRIAVPTSFAKRKTTP